MNQVKAQMGQLGHKWVNLSTNGSTWAQIGKHGAQLVKLMVQLSKIPAQRAKLGFLWLSSKTIHASLLDFIISKKSIIIDP